MAREATVLALVNLIGLIVSVTLLSTVLSSPSWVESRLLSFAQSQVREAVDSRLAALGNAPKAGETEGRFARLAERFGVEAEATEQFRNEVLPGLIDRAAAEHCAESCGEKLVRTMGEIADSSLAARVSQLRVGQETLGAFIAERYERTVAGLLSDLTRFSAVNALAFALALGLFVRGKLPGPRLTAFGLVLTGYILWASWSYVFGQDWARSILFEDWAAMAHQVSMVAVVVVLTDWLFLHGMVTNAAITAISAIIPC